ncbi:MAG TPA: hypothetical protein VK053_14465 [Jiangellaceae bacterium]|nr:hypothetical protein [Jiangellaceae bacterium]
MTTTELSRYTTQLIRRLRWRNTPQADIDDAVAVVESHVRDTGQSPEQEFGSAREYARTFPRHDLPEHWPRHIAALLIASLAGMLLIVAISAETRGENLVGGWDPVVGIVVSVVVLVAWAAYVIGATVVVRRRRGAD